MVELVLNGNPDYIIKLKKHLIILNLIPFLQLSYDSFLGGNNHKWINNTANVNLLDGLAPGDYKITVYYKLGIGMVPVTYMIVMVESKLCCYFF